MKTPFIDSAEEIRKVQALIDEYHFQLNPTDKVEDLSVGLCQQAEILKMLYRNVRILILDEPTSVLTPQEVDRLIDNLKALREGGKTIIVITHKLREVMELSDSVTVIRHGKVIGTVQTKDTNEKELAQMMVGRDVVLTVSNEGAQPPGTRLPIVSRTCTPSTRRGMKWSGGVSFEVHKGEVFGIAGVEGNGQSELVKLLTGLMTATKGRVTIAGKEITNLWPDQLRKAGLGIVPEDRYAQGLCRDMSIPDNCIAGYWSDTEVCRCGVLKQKSIRKRARDYIEKYDIRVAEENGNVSQLSGGNAQKIIIAREFESHPHLIIACQPTRGVDVGSIEFIHKQLLNSAMKGMPCC